MLASLLLLLTGPVLQGPVVHEIEIDGKPEDRKTWLRSVSPTESYVHVSPPEEGKEALFYLDGEDLRPVVYEDGNKAEGELSSFLGDVSVYFTLLYGRRRLIYRLEQGTALLLRNTENKPLSVKDYEMVGRGPEFLQESYETVVYRLDGSTAHPVWIDKLEAEYPVLVPSPTELYLADTRGLYRKTPGRMWRITEQGAEPLLWPNGDPADFGLTKYYTVGRVTFVLTNDYEMQRDPEAEVHMASLWQLAGRELLPVFDGEGDLLQSYTLLIGAAAALEEALYVRGLVSDSDDIHLWRVNEEGECSLVMSEGRLFGGMHLDVEQAGDRLLIERHVSEDEDPELWLGEGEAAVPIVTEEATPLLGKAQGVFRGDRGVIVHKGDGGRRLFYVDETHVAHRLEHDSLASRASSLSSIQVVPSRSGFYVNYPGDDGAPRHVLHVRLP